MACLFTYISYFHYNAYTLAIYLLKEKLYLSGISYASISSAASNHHACAFHAQEDSNLFASREWFIETLLRNTYRSTDYNVLDFSINQLEEIGSGVCVDVAFMYHPRGTYKRSPLMIFIHHTFWFGEAIFCFCHSKFQMLYFQFGYRFLGLLVYFNAIINEKKMK